MALKPRRCVLEFYQIGKLKETTESFQNLSRSLALYAAKKGIFVAGTLNPH
jgi:hypothetical protein